MNEMVGTGANLIRFLWVEFQLKNIFSQTSAGHMEKCLASLPEDMDQTYERIVDLINQKPKPQRELARRALMWISYAQRPLRLEELLFAVAMETNAKSDEELRSMVPTMKTLVDVCTPLITLVDATGVDAPGNRYFDETTVRFVHFSVQEFLLLKSRDWNNRSMTTLNIGPELAQVEMAQMCITFMLFCYRMDGMFYCYTSLATYARTAWVDHLRAVKQPNENLMMLIVQFFEFGVFTEYHYGKEEESVVLGHLERSKFSPSTIALIFDLPLVFDHLEKRKKDQLCYPDDACAMHLAARHSSCQAIKQLCIQGFDVAQLDRRGNSPLYYAASREVIQCLLDNGADVNANDGSALQAAAINAEMELVLLLLGRGANVNAQGGKHGSPLQAASAYGTQDMV